MEKTKPTKAVLDDNAIEIKPSLTKRYAVWIALLILLCLQGGGLYWLWMQQQSENEKLTQQFMASIPTPVDTNKFEQSLAAQEQNVTTQLGALKNDQLAMQDALEVLKNSQQLTKGDVEYYWAIAEVTYLLNIANQQLLLVKNIEGAQQALQLADTRIESLHDYRLHPLRALISDEMLALASVNKVDVAGMSLQLESALDGVNDLQVLMAAPVATESTETLSGENWQGVLQNAWQEVKSLVVIRHQQDGAAAVLVPEQRYFLYQNLQLKLETAQRALLNGNEDVFKQSLASAKEWLTVYFVGDKRDAMLALLDKLESENIEVELPDISSSLTWLRGFAQ